MKITDISVYETFHAGSITKIGVWNKKKEKYVTVYKGDAVDIQESRIFEPKIQVITVQFILLGYVNFETVDSIKPTVLNYICKIDR